MTLREQLLARSDEIRSMVAAGMTVTAISDILEIPISAVSTYVRASEHDYDSDQPTPQALHIPRSSGAKRINQLIYYGYDPDDHDGTYVDALRESVRCRLRTTNIRWLAREYDISYSHIYHIRRGRTLGSIPMLERLGEILSTTTVRGYCGRQLISDAWRYHIKRYLTDHHYSMNSLAEHVGCRMDLLHKALTGYRYTIDDDLYQRINDAVDAEVVLRPATRQLKKVQEDFLANLWRMGKTMTEISRMMCIRRGSVRKYLDRQGLL